MNGKPLKIISRAEWGAVEPTSPREPHSLPWDSTVLSWTTETTTSEDTNECAMKMRSLQADHMAKGEPDICYNFCLCGDGLVYEGRGWNVAHSKQLEYPESYGESLVVGVFGERRKEFDGTWWGAPSVMIPGFNLAKYGFDKNYIKDISELYEDHENVIKPIESPE